MKRENELVHVVETPTALGRPDNPIADMMRAMVEKGITAENAAAFEKMCDTVLKMDAVQAQKVYMAAKAALQDELPNVMATKAIPGKDGRIRSTFAPYEEIMAVIQPYMVKHGFSVSFSIRVEDDGKRLAAICRLSHSGGHSEENEFSVRIGSGPPGCSDTQADGAARSYARRGALCDALNIVIDHDTDARLEGAVVSAEVARELQEGVRAQKIDEAAFLRLAGADSFASIREGKVGVLRSVIAGAKPMPDAPPPVLTPNQEIKNLVGKLAGPDPEARKQAFEEAYRDAVGRPLERDAKGHPIVSEADTLKVLECLRKKAT